jgi:4'-phosphopantetheinyl transferase EntD
MPLFQHYRDESKQWGIWKIEESLQELSRAFPNGDLFLQQAGRFPSPSRKLEWVGVRRLLHQLLGEEKTIAYHPNGKPYLTDLSHHISISHTGRYVAILLSPTAAVSIDIERYSDRISPLAPRFMRPDEPLSPYEGDPRWSQLLHWSAKETLFKAINCPDIDFKQHLQIEPFHPQPAGTLRCHEYRTPQQQTFHLHYALYPDLVLTWWVEEI